MGGKEWQNYFPPVFRFPGFVLLEYREMKNFEMSLNKVS
jgi:hypothetical protein